MTSIVALALNPSIDISTTVDEVLPGRKLRCHAQLVFPGGGGVNVARAAARLGADVQLIYPTGGATGQLLRRMIDREGIANLAIDIREETREDFTVLENKTGAEFRFVLPGPEFSGNEWRACLQALEAVQVPPKYLVASGSIPPGVPLDFYARVARIAKAGGSRFVVDASGEALQAALDEGVHLVKPNVRELTELMPEGSGGTDALIAAARKLVAGARAEIVALSMGDEGALLVTQDGAWQAASPRVKMVSSVGAGDSFLGALLWGLESGLSEADAFRYGVAAGAAAVLRPGTALSDPADVRRLVQEVSVREFQLQAT
jgi:6-phosphofructokinase 2